MRNLSPTGEAARWSLMSRRGLALVYILQHPGCTRKELAEALHIGNRRAAQLLAELRSAGAVRGSDRSSGRVHYEVELNAPLETAGPSRTLAEWLRGIA